MNLFKIQSTNFNSMLSSRNLPFAAKTITTTAKKASDTASKDADKKNKAINIEEVENNTGKDYKLENILNKFKSGKKLTAGELEYLSRNAPDMYRKITAVMKRREQLEARLDAAESEEETAQIISEEMTAVQSITDDFEKQASAGQLQDAISKHRKKIDVQI